MSLRLSWEEAIARGICRPEDAPSVKATSPSRTKRATSLRAVDPVKIPESLYPEQFPYPPEALIGRNTTHSRALQALFRKPELIEGKREHYDQVYVFHYFELLHPEIYELLHSTPNAGKRGSIERGFILSEGLKKGYPDISLDMACGGYHGLRCELKQEHLRESALTEDQREWRAKLNAAGYYSCVAFGWKQAISTILAYARNEIIRGESL